MKALFPFLLFLIAAVHSVPAEAAFISSATSVSVDGVETVSHNQWLSTSFRSGGNADFFLTDYLTLRVDAVAPNAHIMVAITGTLNGRPNLDDIRVHFDEAPLITPVSLGTVTIFSLAPDVAYGEQRIEPNEDYWIVFGVEEPDWESDLPTGLYHWSYAGTSGPYNASPGWTVGSQIAAGNTARANWTPDTNTPYVFGLSVTAVPEPTGAALLVCAGIGALLHRRGQNRSKSLNV
jgi:hypothetical protein